MVEEKLHLTAEFLRSRLSWNRLRSRHQECCNQVNIPAIGGTVLRNVGVIRNSGFETGTELEQQHLFLGSI